jgi:hypothetical protein
MITVTSLIPFPFSRSSEVVGELAYLGLRTVENTVSKKRLVAVDFQSRLEECAHVGRFLDYDYDYDYGNE